MLNEVSQRKTNTLISLICGIKRNRLTDTENKLVVTSGASWRRGPVQYRHP